MDEKNPEQPAQQENLPFSPSLETLPRVVPDYIPTEVFLETIGYFTPSSKRIKKTLTKEITIGERTNPDGTTTVLKVAIVGTGKYGLPITSDQDYYRALLKILDEITDQGSDIPDPLQLPVKRLMRYAGKHVSQKEIEEVKNWVRINRYTGIQGSIYNAATREYDEKPAEPLFRDYRLRGERLPNGEIAETTHVWLAEWFCTNYFHHHLRPIDMAFHRRLRKPIAKALYPLLETGWYASSGSPYTKSYRDLCDGFLLTKYPQLSRIKQQLDPSHRELQRERFLGTWGYRKAAAGRDWVITYSPGEKFFADQQARLERRARAEQLTLNFSPSPPPTPPSDEDLRYQVLLEDILAVCGDRRNRAAYHKVLKTYPVPLIEMTLSETRQAYQEGRIKKNKGAYFMDTLKRLAALRANAQTSS